MKRSNTILAFVALALDGGMLLESIPLPEQKGLRLRGA